MISKSFDENFHLLICSHPKHILPVRDMLLNHNPRKKSRKLLDGLKPVGVMSLMWHLSALLQIC